MTQKRMIQKTENQNRSNVFLKSGWIVLVAVLVVSTLVNAGSLVPLATPAATGYTLEDIYTRVTTNATATSSNHGFTPGSSPASSFHSLADIYSAIPTVSAATVLTGTSYLSVSGTYDSTNLATSTVKNGVAFGISLTGLYPSSAYLLPGASATTDLNGSGGSITSSNGSVEWWQSSGTRVTATLDFATLSNVCNTDTSNNSAGTLSTPSSTILTGSTYCGTAGSLLGSLWMGTDATGTYPGGSQSSGGVDDFNAGLAPSAGRYVKNWTPCNSGNSYCGTGDSGADAKDDSTGLVWSLPCNGSGCASFSDSAPLTYSWDNSATNNNSRTASQLCSDHAGWSLPHQKQLLQAYIDGSYGGLEDQGTDRNYLSATTASDNTTLVRRMLLSSGNSNSGNKTTPNYVRCVR
jgi:hypothetical protein